MRTLRPETRGALRRKPGAFDAWLIQAGDQAQVLDNLSSLSPTMLRPALDHVLAWLDRMDAASEIGAGPRAVVREVFQDERVEDGHKIRLAEHPFLAGHPDVFLPALPRHLHRELRERLRIDDAWLDLGRPVSAELQILSEYLLEPEELVDLQRRRSEAAELQREQEDRRRRMEEEERARVEAARLRAERERGEREQALRRALAYGRGSDDRHEFVMTEEFQAVFELIERGRKLLFVTGSPGTGKSTLIRALRDRLSSRNVVALSLTGTAALNVGGQTIHSFFAMPPRMLEEGWLTQSRGFRDKAQALEILIVDEVSMVRPDMIDAMDRSLRRARGDPRPFGGVQLVLVGDLYQLPPIIDNTDAVRTYYDRVYHGERFFYGARVFGEGHPLLVELTTVFRQRQKEYLELLGRVRDGTVSGEDIDWLNQKLRTLPDFSNSEFHLIVAPRRATAASENHRQLDQLPGDARSYEARLEGQEPPDRASGAGSDMKYPADYELRLKPGAQVMLVKNDAGKHWTNGDLGIVEELSDGWVRVTTATGTWRVERARWPLVRYEVDPRSHRLTPQEYGSFTQFPLRLAWASTIHKMQGQTVDRIRIDLTGGTFESGMTYVALSRCRTLEGMRLTRPLVMADLQVSKGVRQYLDGLERYAP